VSCAGRGRRATSARTGRAPVGDDASAAGPRAQGSPPSRPQPAQDCASTDPLDFRMQPRPRLRMMAKWACTALTLAVLSLYPTSARWTITWEGPSDWELQLNPGRVAISMTDIGRLHFRGPYGRGWSVEDAPEWRSDVGGTTWSLDQSVDFGPYSIYVYPLWVLVLFDQPPRGLPVETGAPAEPARCAVATDWILHLRVGSPLAADRDSAPG
jgi:hypothetical protein